MFSLAGFPLYFQDKNPPLMPITISRRLTWLWLEKGCTMFSFFLAEVLRPLLQLAVRSISFLSFTDCLSYHCVSPTFYLCLSRNSASPPLLLSRAFSWIGQAEWTKFRWVLLLGLASSITIDHKITGNHDKELWFLRNYREQCKN